MHAGNLVLRAFVLTASLIWAQAASAQGAVNLDNATCLGCHGMSGFSAPRGDGATRALSVAADHFAGSVHGKALRCVCLLYTSPSPRDRTRSRMPSSA